MIKTLKYVRKPLTVVAVQVTIANMDEVAKWCTGEVVKTDNEAYIKVRVLRVLNERQTKAYPGDWVLYAGTGYKVYTAKAFNKSFDPLDGVANDEAVQGTKG